MQDCSKLFLFFCAIIVSEGVLSLSGQTAQLAPLGQIITISVPLGFPPVPVSPDNPLTAESIALGRRLFFDPILSGNGTFSCASCHHPQFGFADDKFLTKGAAGQASHRNVPTVVNSTYFTTLFWDGRVPSLEQQVQGPIESAEEMANTVEEVEKRLNADPTYR